MTTAKEQLQQWFAYLQDFQVACEQVDTNAAREDLLTFANDKISADLSTANEQNSFCVVAQNSTGLTVTPADLAASSSFEALLETVWNPLNVFVASFVRSCAPAPFSSMAFTDFVQEKLAAVFPGGQTDANWSILQKGLTSSIPAACYSTNHQTAANALFSAPNTTIQNVIDLVSKMG